MSHPLLVLVFAGPLINPALAAADAPAVKAERAPVARIVAELRRKDTDKIDVITAGEKQKSTFDRCSDSADSGLCRVLVSVVNIAAIIGTSIPR
jgi:hypothetical protein